MLALLVGGICILGGLLRGGFVVNFLVATSPFGLCHRGSPGDRGRPAGKFLGLQRQRVTRSSSSWPTRSANLGKVQGLTVAGLRHCHRVHGAVAPVRTASARGAHGRRTGLVASSACSTCPPSGVAVTGTVPSGLPSLKVPKVGIHDLGSLASLARWGLRWCAMSNRSPLPRPWQTDLAMR